MQLFTIARIPVRLHVTFVVLVAGVIGWALVTSGLHAAVDTALLSVALFGSVVLHELGHALVARRFGIGTAHITLYPFGGIAAIDRMPRNPRQELLIAVAGPAVNALLFGGALSLWAVTGFRALATIAALNLVMGLFNLIPAFPMDGGRVLRALLATRMGFVPASELAIRVGRVFAWLFLGVGVAWGLWGLAVIGVFLHLALYAERARLRRMRFTWTPPRWRAA